MAASQSVQVPCQQAPFTACFIKGLTALMDDKAKESEGTRDFIFFFFKEKKTTKKHTHTQTSLLLLKDTLQIELVQTLQVLIIMEPIRGESCSCDALCVILMGWKHYSRKGKEIERKTNENLRLGEKNMLSGVTGKITSQGRGMEQRREEAGKQRWNKRRETKTD